MPIRVISGSKKEIHMRKRDILLTVFIILLIIAAVVCLLGYLLYRHYQKETGFLDKTLLNGRSIVDYTPEEVTAELAEKYNTAEVGITLSENDTEALSGTLEDIGYTFDEKSMSTYLEYAFEDQKKDIFSLIESLIKGTSLSISPNYLTDDETFNSFINASNLADERVETVDWEIVFDEEAEEYLLEGGVKGNIIDNAVLREYVRTAVGEAIDNAALLNDGVIEDITLDIPEDAYLSEEPKGDPVEMQAEVDQKNDEIRRRKALDAYKASSVTYVFGNEKQVLDYDTFGSWLSVDDQYVVSIDEQAAMDYVEKLGQTYNTRYHDRTFAVTGGGLVTIEAGWNEYGYTIDEYSEFYQLLTDLHSLSEVEREPVYYATNSYGNPYYYKRNGIDDLCGTYVEVNLSVQHMWYYKDGVLIVQSDLVSGIPDGTKDTVTGTFPLAYKQSPATLTSYEVGDSYENAVSYWMPFYEGQGLHDAPWRTEFGGSIFLTAGSHGCINLPFEAARILYENIEPGVAIIIYK